MLFQPRLSREFLEDQLSKLDKRNYNQFVWWRRYQSRPTLPEKSPLYNKIVNGDYEHSDYLYQAEHENYLLDDAIKGFHYYEDKLDKISLFRTRYKRLLEDYEKDEKEIMNNLRKDFKKEFKISKEELDEIIESFDGTVLDLYNHVKNLIKL